MEIGSPLDEREKTPEITLGFWERTGPGGGEGGPTGRSSARLETATTDGCWGVGCIKAEKGVRSSGRLGNKFLLRSGLCTSGSDRTTGLCTRVGLEKWAGVKRKGFF